MSAAKKRMGRPPLSATGEVGERYEVHLPPSVADKLRQYGDGSLSQGIIRAAKRVRSSDQIGANHAARHK